VKLIDDILCRDIFEMIDDPVILFLPGRKPVANEAYGRAFPGWEEIDQFGNEFNLNIKSFWQKHIINLKDITKQIARLRHTHKEQNAVWYLKNGTKLEVKAQILNLSGGLFAELWILRDVYGNYRNTDYIERDFYEFGVEYTVKEISQDLYAVNLLSEDMKNCEND
jgi:hypothetical protein